MKLILCLIISSLAFKAISSQEPSNLPTTTSSPSQLPQTLLEVDFSNFADWDLTGPHSSTISPDLIVGFFEVVGDGHQSGVDSNKRMVMRFSNYPQLNFNTTQTSNCAIEYLSSVQFSHRHAHTIDNHTKPSYEVGIWLDSGSGYQNIENFTAAPSNTGSTLNIDINTNLSPDGTYKIKWKPMPNNGHATLGSDTLGSDFFVIDDIVLAGYVTCTSTSPSQSISPSSEPSISPSQGPSQSSKPSDAPSISPSLSPSQGPSQSATGKPSDVPSVSWAPTFSLQFELGFVQDEIMSYTNTDKRVQFDLYKNRDMVHTVVIYDRGCGVSDGSDEIGTNTSLFKAITSIDGTRRDPYTNNFHIVVELADSVQSTHLFHPEYYYNVTNSDNTTTSVPVELAKIQFCVRVDLLKEVTDVATGNTVNTSVTFKEIEYTMLLNLDLSANFTVGSIAVRNAHITSHYTHFPTQDIVLSTYAINDVVITTNVNITNLTEYTSDSSDFCLSLVPFNATGEPIYEDELLVYDFYEDDCETQIDFITKNLSYASDWNTSGSMNFCGSYEHSNLTNSAIWNPVIDNVTSDVVGGSYVFCTKIFRILQDPSSRRRRRRTKHNDTAAVTTNRNNDNNNMKSLARMLNDNEEVVSEVSLTESSSVSNNDDLQSFAPVFTFSEWNNCLETPGEDCTADSSEIISLDYDYTACVCNDKGICDDKIRHHAGSTINICIQLQSGGIFIRTVRDLVFTQDGVIKMIPINKGLPDDLTYIRNQYTQNVMISITLLQKFFNYGESSSTKSSSTNDLAIMPLTVTGTFVLGFTETTLKRLMLGDGFNGGNNEATFRDEENFFDQERFRYLHLGPKFSLQIDLEQDENDNDDNLDELIHLDLGDYIDYDIGDYIASFAKRRTAALAAVLTVVSLFFISF